MSPAQQLPSSRIKEKWFSLERPLHVKIFGTVLSMMQPRKRYYFGLEEVENKLVFYGNKADFDARKDYLGQISMNGTFCSLDEANFKAFYLHTDVGKKYFVEADNEHAAYCCLNALQQRREDGAAHNGESCENGDDAGPLLMLDRRHQSQANRWGIPILIRAVGNETERTRKKPLSSAETAFGTASLDCPYGWSQQSTRLLCNPLRPPKQHLPPVQPPPPSKTTSASCATPSALQNNICLLCNPPPPSKTTSASCATPSALQNNICLLCNPLRPPKQHLPPVQPPPPSKTTSASCATPRPPKQHLPPVQPPPRPPKQHLPPVQPPRPPKQHLPPVQPPPPALQNNICLLCNPPPRPPKQHLPPVQPPRPPKQHLPPVQPPPALQNNICLLCKTLVLNFKKL